MVSCTKYGCTVKKLRVSKIIIQYNPNSKLALSDLGFMHFNCLYMKLLFTLNLHSIVHQYGCATTFSQNMSELYQNLREFVWKRKGRKTINALPELIWAHHIMAWTLLEFHTLINLGSIPQSLRNFLSTHQIFVVTNVLVPVCSSLSRNFGKKSQAKLFSSE